MPSRLARLPPPCPYAWPACHHHALTPGPPAAARAAPCSDPVPPDHMARLSSARQGYCKRWWPVPPECLALAHGTRVCIVRVDLAGEMAEVALPTLMEHVPGFQNDLLVYNSG